MSHDQISHCGNRELHSPCQILTVFCSHSVKWRRKPENVRLKDAFALARWLAQTLGELEGRAWRLSHPLVGAYRLAAQIAHDRQIWFKRLATPPAAYAESPCCRAPFLPLLTRDA